MTKLVLTDVDETVLARLQARAARHHTSIEEEARRALSESVSQDFAAVISRLDAFVAALPSEALMMMLGESLRRAETTPAMRKLAVRLIRRLAEGETLSRRYAAAGLTTLADMPVRPQDTGLATPAIAALVREFPAIGPRAYADHALRPVVRGEVRVDPPEFVDALRAAVRLLEPAA
jgi:hypothetical protein